MEKHWLTEKASRQRANLSWKICFLLMVVFFIGVPLPPMPARMALPLAVLFSLMTGYFFYRAKRMPIREALLYARSHRGLLTVSILCADLDLDLPTAETLLNVMQKRNLIQVDDDALMKDGELIYRVRGFDLPE
jgi:hypothetical protein